MSDKKFTMADGIAYQAAWLKMPQGAAVAALQQTMDSEVRQLTAFQNGVQMILGCLSDDALDVVAERFGVLPVRAECPDLYRLRIVSKIVFGNEGFGSISTGKP